MLFLRRRNSKDFLEAGKKRLAGDVAREANTAEVKEGRESCRIFIPKAARNHHETDTDNGNANILCKT